MKEKEKITENKVIIENGEIKTILYEETQQRGMSIEEARRLFHDKVKKRFELLKHNITTNG